MLRASARLVAEGNRRAPMERIVYRHDGFTPESEARISLFDRGFLFGDAVYEVTAALDGRLIDEDLHLERLERSLSELEIPMPLPRAEIAGIQAELVARNGLKEGVVYLHVSRGAADRDFIWSEDLKPLLIGFTQTKIVRDSPSQREGIAVDLAPDPRWARRDVKTAMLLGQALAKRAARRRGFQEVWLVEEGEITEGASSTAWIVTREGRIVTRGNSWAVLPGCTRRAVLRLCAEQGLSFEERAFSPEEAQAAAEAFVTSATSFVTPVVRIGDEILGDGRPGPTTRRLQALYLEAVSKPEAAPA